MKKITSFLMALFALTALNAQIVYQTVLTDNFETATSDVTIGTTVFKTGGFPSSFNVQKQTGWSTNNATLNVNPCTGTVWKDLYSNNSTAANKTYSVVTVAENRPGGVGSQCIKFNLTGTAFSSYATPFTVRLRSNDNVLSFNTAAGESLTKYEATFWARVDGADKVCMLNTQNPNTYLTLTSTWQKFTITRYATGTSATALGIDFYPLSDNADFAVYFDDFELKQRKIAYTTAATNISSNAFTANWTAVEGANAYSVIVEKTDGATTPTWTPVTGSPFAAGNVQSLNISNIDAGTYRYRVTATDGNITTVESNNTFTTLVVSGITETMVKSMYVADGAVCFDANSNLRVQVYNQLGQKVYDGLSTSGLNKVQLRNAGVYIVNVAGDVHKVLLN